MSHTCRDLCSHQSRKPIILKSLLQVDMCYPMYRTLFLKQSFTLALKLTPERPMGLGSRGHGIASGVGPFVGHCTICGPFQIL